MGFLNELDEITNQTARIGALFQVFENASDELEVIVDGSFCQEWEPLIDETGYCKVPFGNKTTLLRRK